MGGISPVFGVVKDLESEMRAFWVGRTILLYEFSSTGRILPVVRTLRGNMYIDILSPAEKRERKALMMKMKRLERRLEKKGIKREDWRW